MCSILALLGPFLLSISETSAAGAQHSENSAPLPTSQATGVDRSRHGVWPATADASAPHVMNAVSHPTRHAAFWFKPARATYAADLAMIRSKSNLISVLFVYCEFTVLPDGSFGVASNQSWFHANWGDHTMCTPQYFSELSGDSKRMKVQLVLSMGNALVTSYRRAFANPKPLLAGMLDTIQSFDAEIVTGWNVDWEPCHPHSSAPGTLSADGLAFAHLLEQMKSAHARANRNYTISVDVSQWCNMTSNFAALAAAADSVQDMGTYHAESEANFQSKLSLTSAVPRNKLWVGLGFGEQMMKFPYETTPASLSNRFQALISAGVLNVAMFELPSAQRLDQWNMSQAWWQELAKWVATPLQTPKSGSRTAAAAVNDNVRPADAFHDAKRATNQAVMMSPTFTTDPRVFDNISANVIAHCPASFTTLSMKAWPGSYAPTEKDPLPAPDAAVVSFLQSVKAKSKGQLQVWGGVEVCPGRAYDCMLNYSRSKLTGVQLGQAVIDAGLDGITLYASPYCNNKNCKRTTGKYARGIAEMVKAVRNVTKAYRQPGGIAVSWWQNEWDNPQIVAAAGGGPLFSYQTVFYMDSLSDCLRQCGAQCAAGESYGDIQKHGRNFSALMLELKSKVRWISMNHGAEQPAPSDFWAGLAMYQQGV